MEDSLVNQTIKKIIENILYVCMHNLFYSRFNFNICFNFSGKGYIKRY